MAGRLSAIVCRLVTLPYCRLGYVGGWILFYILYSRAKQLTLTVCRLSRQPIFDASSNINNQQQSTMNTWAWEIPTWLSVYCVMWLYFVLKCVVNQRTSKSSSVQLHPYKSVLHPCVLETIYFCMVLYNLLIIQLYCANLKPNTKTWSGVVITIPMLYVVILKIHQFFQSLMVPEL